MRRTLHLGCGRKTLDVRIGDVVTLDADEKCNPDVVCVLGRDELPFPENHFDAAVAIHVLEHIGRVGETWGWFFFWEELYRVLKPGAELQFESPLWSSVWAWADPSHVRPLSPEALGFFDQANYRIKGSAISPYRIRCDFVALPPYIDTMNGNFRGVLRARKPLRPWWEV